MGTFRNDKSSTETRTSSGYEDCQGREFNDKVEHVLIGKTKLIYSIVIILVPVIGFFFKIESDIALIKQEIAQISENYNKVAATMATDHDALVSLVQLHKIIPNSIQ